MQTGSARILVVIGTRPEGIKLAPVVAALRTNEDFAVRCCITGQHRDLLRPVLEFFGLPCGRDLNIMTPGQTLDAVAAQVLAGVAALLREERFDCVVVQGDTTTAFAAGLAAFYERVPVAHVEAGLRSHHLAQPFPEEGHRRLLDVFADHCFAPTEGARQNLLREGVAPDRIVVTGNTGIDALFLARDLLEQEPRPLPVALPGGAQLAVLTMHRRESFGPPLERVFHAMAAVVEEHPALHVLFPVHPNPHVRAAAGRILGACPRVHLTAPLEYPDFVSALLQSNVILTDSGGVQEEAPALGKAVLVLRETTERPEGVAGGFAEVVGTQPQRIVAGVRKHLQSHPRPPALFYGDGQASLRIVEALRQALRQRRAA